MKWHRLVLVLAAVAVAFVYACESPTVPRMPPKDDNTDTEDPDPSKTHGFLLEEMGIYWV